MLARSLAMLLVGVIAASCGQLSREPGTAAAPAAATSRPDLPSATLVAQVTTAPSATSDPVRMAVPSVAVVTPPPAAVAPKATLPTIAVPTVALPTPPPAPSITIIPVPQTPGPRPTWTATPNPALRPGISGCVAQIPGATSGMMDCVGRGLPPGAPVAVTANEMGGPTYFVSWLPPADKNGDVPFPYRRPGPGTVQFTVSGGGTSVTWQHVWY